MVTKQMNLNEWNVFKGEKLDKFTLRLEIYSLKA